MSFKTSFQWFADFQTSTTGMQIVQFSAGGDVVRRRLAPMFAHYRKYKLGAIHVKFVPAATLPVDPTGLSYDEGEQTVDPRDMFNPGLVRNTNGEDVYVPSDDILNSDFADSLYYSTMLDKRWKKFRLQKGCVLRAFPKFWGIANLRQNMYPGFVSNVPSLTNSTDGILQGTTTNTHPLYAGTSGISSSVVDIYSTGSSTMGLYQTGQKIPMGWMPTGASLKDEYGLLNGLTSSDIVIKTVWDVTETLATEGALPVVIATFDTEIQAQDFADQKAQFSSATYTVSSRNITVDGSDIDAGVSFAPVPEIPDLLTLVLPKAHKTQFFYRVYVKEDVYFADPVTSINAIESPTNGTYFAPIDQFLRSQTGAYSPGSAQEALIPNQRVVYNDGGDRGDTP